eukprot:TRINITY_DN63549_c0_g1_i1.p1 TRINITY_DN63549_c0_g1~~TRINITY_DN63549_c0_g1_i1.p1  ORF type:complete len:471 (+),score=60.87 TRINITY_DN63549_c0_g1_i1:242-1654(+)
MNGRQLPEPVYFDARAAVITNRADGCHDASREAVQKNCLVGTSLSQAVYAREAVGVPRTYNDGNGISRACVSSQSNFQSQSAALHCVERLPQHPQPQRQPAQHVLLRSVARRDVAEPRQPQDHLQALRQQVTGIHAGTPMPVMRNLFTSVVPSSPVPLLVDSVVTTTPSHSVNRGTEHIFTLPRAMESTAVVPAAARASLSTVSETLFSTVSALREIGSDRTIEWPNEENEYSGHVPHCSDELSEPLREFLDFACAEGLLDDLPLDVRGVLRISCPFCGPFLECRLICRWLADTFLSQPSVKGVHIFGTELHVSPEYGFPMMERWAAQAYPGLVLNLRQADLTRETLPENVLTIGLHPEASSSPWDAITVNVLRSASRGVVLQATFFEAEARAIVKVSARCGVECQVLESPRYTCGAGSATSGGCDFPWMRFLCVARPGCQGPPLRGHLAALPWKTVGEATFLRSGIAVS